MKKRSMFAAVVALGLIATGCGDSGDGKLSGAAVEEKPKPTTTTTIKFGSGYRTGDPLPTDPRAFGLAPGTTSFDWVRTYTRAAGEPSGAVVALTTASGATLARDFPRQIVGATIDVVGLMESLTWSQVLSDPITIVMRMTAANDKLLGDNPGAVKFSMSVQQGAGSGEYAMLTTAAPNPTTGTGGVGSEPPPMNGTADRPIREKVAATKDVPAHVRVTLTLRPTAQVQAFYVGSLKAGGPASSRNLPVRSDVYTKLSWTTAGPSKK